MSDIITERYNAALKQCTIFQQQLADQIGVCKQCISGYKSGRTVPSIQTLRLICEALEVSADYLLGLEDENGTKKYR